MNMYKIVLIDLDNTVFDFSLGEKNAAKETFEKFGIKHDEKLITFFSEINEKYFQKYASKEMTREEFHHMRFKEIVDVISCQCNPDDMNKHYIENLALQCEFMPGAYETLKYLSSKYILCAASNGKIEVQTKRIEKANVADFFDKIYVSSAVGYNKPDKEFFDYIFSDYKEYNKEDFTIIGDRESSDILGGINAGIDTCFYNYKNDTPTLKSRYIINSLKEILKIL